jgi:hypothetical protein
MTDFTSIAQEHSFDAPQNEIPDWQPFPVGTNDSDFSTTPLPTRHLWHTKILISAQVTIFLTYS